MLVAVMAKATQERNSERGAGPRWNEGCPFSAFALGFTAASCMVVYSVGSIVSPYWIKYSWFRTWTPGSLGCFENHFAIPGIWPKAPLGNTKGFEGSKA